jgi:hypothetical protein
MSESQLQNHPPSPDPTTGIKSDSDQLLFIGSQLQTGNHSDVMKSIILDSLDQTIHLRSLLAEWIDERMHADGDDLPKPKGGRSGLGCWYAPAVFRHRHSDRSWYHIQGGDAVPVMTCPNVAGFPL